MISNGPKSVGEKCSPGTLEQLSKNDTNTLLLFTNVSFHDCLTVRVYVKHGFSELKFKIMKKFHLRRTLPILGRMS